MKTKTWEAFKKESLKNPDVQREYDRLKPEYEVVRALIEARKNKSLSQEKLAQKMDTTQSVIARLESGSGNPTINLLTRLAAALDSHLEIKFIPNNS